MTSGDSSADAVIDERKDSSTDGDADSGPLTYEQVVLADGPVSYWHLDEKGGVLFADAMGRHPLELGGDASGVVYSNPGVTDGGSAVRMIGGALLQNDDGAFDLSGLKPFTLEIWMRPTSTDTAYHNVFAKYVLSDAAPAPANGADLFWSSSLSRLQFERWQDGGVTDFVGLNTQLPDDRFVHVVVTMDGTRLVLYVNGAAVSIGKNPAPSATDPKVPFQWGRGYIGYLDELAFYDKALSMEQVSAHFHAAE
ncbi:Autotransporter adhesin [Labilithrix luteola]|uniref:Autotransporter adhesin n=2 Tax=Labilithrix luteola TaxID=1391654 RepID=A0A0K1PPB8_9BACT|nr:Autotransporter adhesin [Labilithrix luteola]